MGEVVGINSRERGESMAELESKEAIKLFKEGFIGQAKRILQTLEGISNYSDGLHRAGKLPNEDEDWNYYIKNLLSLKTNYGHHFALLTARYRSESDQPSVAKMADYLTALNSADHDKINGRDMKAALAEIQRLIEECEDV